MSLEKYLEELKKTSESYYTIYKGEKYRRIFDSHYYWFFVVSDEEEILIYYQDDNDDEEYYLEEKLEQIYLRNKKLERITKTNNL